MKSSLLYIAFATAAILSASVVTGQNDSYYSEAGASSDYYNVDNTIEPYTVSETVAVYDANNQDAVTVPVDNSTQYYPTTEEYQVAPAEGNYTVEPEYQAAVVNETTYTPVAPRVTPYKKFKGYVRNVWRKISCRRANYDEQYQAPEAQAAAPYYNEEGSGCFVCRRRRYQPQQPQQPQQEEYPTNTVYHAPVSVPAEGYVIQYNEGDNSTEQAAEYYEN